MVSARTTSTSLDDEGSVISNAAHHRDERGGQGGAHGAGSEGESVSDALCHPTSQRSNLCNINLDSHDLLPKPLRISKRGSDVAGSSARADPGTSFRHATDRAHPSAVPVPALKTQYIAGHLVIPSRSSSAKSMNTIDGRPSSSRTAREKQTREQSTSDLRSQSMSDHGGSIHVRKQRRSDVSPGPAVISGDKTFRETVTTALSRYMAPNAWNAKGPPPLDAVSVEPEAARRLSPKGRFPSRHALSIVDAASVEATVSAKHQGRRSQESDCSVGIENGLTTRCTPSLLDARRDQETKSKSHQMDRPLTFYLDDDFENVKTTDSSISLCTSRRNSSERSASDPSKHGRATIQILEPTQFQSRASSGPELGVSEFKSRAARPSSKDSSAPSSFVSMTHYSEDYPYRPRSTTLSSNQSEQSQFEQTLAAFPRPPRAIGAIPGQLKTSTSNDKQSRSHRHERPQATILAADVTIIPEVESLDTDGGQTLRVAVDITGDVNLPSRPTRMSPGQDKLDVVICFDLSAASSPAAIVNSCEIVLLLVSMLDAAKDRVGIVTTQTAQLARTISDVKRVDIDEIRAGLAQVKLAGQGSCGPGYLEAAVITAASLLSVVEPEVSENSAPFPGDRSLTGRGHIFLLSANVDPATLNVGGNTPIHLVNPAIVPWHRPRNYTRGWQLYSLLPSRLSSTALSRAEDGLPHRLWKIVESARQDVQLAQLRDISVAVESGTSFEIESILGETVHSSLGMGETVQLLVMLRTGRYASPEQPSLLNAPMTKTELSEDYVSTLANLDIMLGEAVTEVLAVHVTYKHTLLPTNTTLSVSSTASIKRHLPGTPWSPNHSPVDNAHGSRQEQVEKRLAFFIATACPPRRALLTLNQTFGEDGCLSVCPRFLMQVADELRYRVRITEQFHPSAVDFPADLAKTNSSHEPSQVELSDISNIRPLPEHPITTIASPRTPETASPATASIPKPTTLVPTPSSASSTPKAAKKTDQATQIWRDIRKTSKPSTSTAPSRRPATAGGTSENVPPPQYSSRLEAMTDQMSEMKRDALRNKRSVGHDTLRSIVLERQRDRIEEGEGVGWEQTAPWL